MIRATEADRPVIEAFLAKQVHRAMFPLSNLADHGMDGGHDYAMRFWLGANVSGVLSVTDSGMVMPLLAPDGFSAAAEVLTDVPVIGIIGPRDDVRGLEAYGFRDLPRTLDHDEPHFLMPLEGLEVPDGPGDIRPLEDAPDEIIKAWIKDYDLNTLNTNPEGLDAQVERTYARYCAKGSHVVLMDGDVPLAMSGFNARLPQIVQIGGVYTPPELRGRGHARRIVALHLAQAAMQGVGQATLFASSEAACRAYRAIGFEQVGEWTLLLFDGPQRRVVQ